MIVMTSGDTFFTVNCGGGIKFLNLVNWGEQISGKEQVGEQKTKTGKNGVKRVPFFPVVIGYCRFYAARRIPPPPDLRPIIRR